MPNRSRIVLAMVTALFGGCSDAPTSPAYSPQAVVTSSASVEVPFLEQWYFSTCTSEAEQLYTLEGTIRVQEKGDLYVLVGKGKVTTEDGYYGVFNRTFVFKGDRVLHMRFHDIEATSGSGVRMIFSMGMYHATTVEGEPVVYLEKYGGYTCVKG